MLKKVKALILLQWKQLLKQPSMFIILLAVPLLFSLILMYGLQPIFENDTYLERFDVAFVDLDQSFETKAVIHQLTSSEDVKRVVQFVYVDEDEGLERLKNAEVAAMVVIPENFSKDLRIGKNTPVKVVGHSQRPFEYQLFLAMMESGADFITAAQSAVNTVHFFLKDEIEKDQLQSEVQQAIIEFTFQALGRGQIFETTFITETGAFSLEEYYLAASIVVIVFVIGIFQLAVIRNDFSQSMDKRLTLSGFTPILKVTTNFLLCFQMIIIQMLIFVLIYYVWAKPVFTGSIGMFLVTVCFIIASTSGLFTFIASFGFRPFTERLTAFTLSFIFAVIGGCILPLSFFPEWIQDVAPFLVSFWMREGVLYSGYIYDGNIVIKAILIVSGFTIIFFIGALFNETRRGRVL